MTGAERASSCKSVLTVASSTTIFNLTGMNIIPRSRILPHIILTVFFCALAVAATTYPLARMRLGGSPQLSPVHQQLERHTFFEVSAGGPQSQTLHVLVVGRVLPIMADRQEQFSRLHNIRQSPNWPIRFSPSYRHIPPSKSRDSDPSA
jgi:hypothetical protein